MLGKESRQEVRLIVNMRQNDDDEDELMLKLTRAFTISAGMLCLFCDISVDPWSSYRSRWRW